MGIQHAKPLKDEGVSFSKTIIDPQRAGEVYIALHQQLETNNNNAFHQSKVQLSVVVDVDGSSTVDNLHGYQFCMLMMLF